MAGTVVVVLVSAGVYGLMLGPRMQSQGLEIERTRQEAVVLQRENEGLERKVERLERNVESLEAERQEAAPPSPTQKRPRKRPDLKREPKRDGLQKPPCNENDPLCGI
jgi:cell division protein FtsB